MHVYKHVYNNIQRRQFEFKHETDCHRLEFYVNVY